MLPLILLIFLGCFILERSIPGWKLPDVKTWTIRVLLICIGYIINTHDTKTITAISLGGTCFSEPTKTLKNGRRPVGSIPKKNSN